MSAQEAILKFDLGPVVALAMTDPTAALTKLHEITAAKHAEVVAIEKAAASKKNDGPNALETKYDKDEAGKKSAESFLRKKDGVLSSIVDYIGEDPGRTFHIYNAVKDLLLPYLRTEVNFHIMEATPKVASVSRKAEYKKDTNDLRMLVTMVAGITGPGKTSGLVEQDKDGLWQSTVGKFRKQNVSDGTVTGRYARIYRLSWVIDGEEVASGTSIPNIVRMLYHGIDRVGKSAVNLTDLLDSKTKWMTPDFTSATFTVNGHKVTVVRATDTEDDEDGEDEDSEESE